MITNGPALTVLQERPVQVILLFGNRNGSPEKAFRVPDSISYRLVVHDIVAVDPKPLGEDQADGPGVYDVFSILQGEDATRLPEAEFNGHNPAIGTGFRRLIEQNSSPDKGSWAIIILSGDHHDFSDAMWADPSTQPPGVGKDLPYQGHTYKVLQQGIYRNSGKEFPFVTATVP